MIHCSNCNASNPENVKNCQNCSFPLFESEVGNVRNQGIGQNLTFTLIDQNQNEFLLKSGKSTIGRSEKADVIINDVYLSGLHAEVLIDGNQCSIKDLGSKNGTTLDGKKVHTNPVPLRSGSKIQCGATKLSFSNSI